MKADYAVAQAGDLGGTGDALVRAQDKIASMQARAGATDELLQSGVLEDVGGHTDDIQDELDQAATAADVDSQLAALKAKLAAPELTSGDSPAADPAKE
jgi:phage shock protein A